jgi:predicted RNase H-like HicB family nuclease
MSDIKTGRSPSEREQWVKLPTTAWETPSKTLYRCKVIILFPAEEGNGLISVYAATLPGVASQGSTEKEALDNIVSAFEGAFAIYKEAGEDIPWEKASRELEHGAEVRWVFVNG